MPKKKSPAKAKNSSNSLGLANYKHHLIPSTAGGVVAYLMSGVILLGLGVFAAVWVSNMVNHNLHKK